MVSIALNNSVITIGGYDLPKFSVGDIIWIDNTDFDEWSVYLSSVSINEENLF